MLPGLRNYTTLVWSGGSLCAGTWASRTRFALFPFGVASRRQQHQPVRFFFRYASAGRHVSGPETRARHPLGGKQKQTKKPWILINVIWILNLLFSFFCRQTFHRIRINRTNRVRAKARKRRADEREDTPENGPNVTAAGCSSTPCPICGQRMYGSAEELNQHVVQCLRRASSTKYKSVGKPTVRNNVENLF